MRVDILAIGSQGDVQPFVALGNGLQKAGHYVRIVTLGGFEDLVCSHGLEHLAIGDSPQQIAKTAEGRDWAKDRSSSLGFLRGFVRVARSRIEEGIAAYWQGRQDAELLIVSPMGLLVGVSIAERLRIPMIRAQVEPPALQTGYDSEGTKSAAAGLRSAWTATLDVAFNALIWNVLRGSTNAARSKVLGLPPLPVLPRNQIRVPLLCGFSSAVVPMRPDYPQWLHITGYWFVDPLPGWTPPRELIDFLDAGPPPVFIGFGSTPFPEPEATSNLVIQALTRSGQRGIVVAGGTGLRTGKLSDSILSVESVPYDWLLPRVSVAVHQGGAGVTALALRAGRPSVTVPVFGVHPVWGNRIFELGAGARPIPAAQLTEDRLTAAIQAAASAPMQRRAAELGEQIRREDGVTRAVETIHTILGSTPTKAMGHYAR